MIAIEINNLNKRYDKTLAVKNINLKINKGKTIGLLGPNGCGKSTTIGMLLGLIKPTSGKVLINGKNIENNRTDLLEKIRTDYTDLLENINSSGKLEEDVKNKLTEIIGILKKEMNNA